MASPSRKKVVSTARKKSELSNQVIHDVVRDAFKGERIAYFVLDTERTEDGAYILCVANHGVPGFCKMEMGMSGTYKAAKERVKQLNKELGLTDDDVNEIIISTMELPSFH